MEPTPYCWGGGEWEGGGIREEGWYLERWEHLALLFAVDEAVVVLHRDERRKLILDRVA